MRFGGETFTGVPASCTIRPLRDQIILEPIEVTYSDTILVINETKPLKGRILAIGPGHYPKKYDHQDKGKRTKMWDSTRFRPTECKVGDIVELGGAELNGYAFETFRWGDKLCVHCREADVAAVHPRTLEEGAASGPEAVLGSQLPSSASGRRAQRGAQ